MKKSGLFWLLLTIVTSVSAQTHIEQNGIKTSVVTPLSAANEQARRYEIAQIGYNSFHWQPGGIIIIELFNVSFGTGYERYVIENGFLQGANSGSAKLRLVESYGIYHNARIALGAPVAVGTIHGDKPNMALPVFLDVRSYSTYRARITYAQDRVTQVTTLNQLSIADNPTGVNIDDFYPSGAPDDDLLSAGLLRVSGTGNHYIQNGNVGIGTLQPDAKLSVKGTIHAQEVKIDLNVPGPDYVFHENYPLMSLDETEKYIKENKHLPEVPSALQMEKEGVKVSEMQMKLLQKIEELTLHLIEQQKTIRKQQDALTEMQAKMQHPLKK